MSKIDNQSCSMDCSSMVSVAAFGSNPGWFAVSNSNQKWTFVSNTSMW